MKSKREIAMHVLIRKFITVLFFSVVIQITLPMSYTHATGDGPRAYQLLPDGTDALSVYSLFTSGNQSADPGTVIKGSDLDVNLGILQYTHSFHFLNQQSALFGVLPFGEVKGDINLSSGRALSSSSSGLGDMQLGAVVGVLGSPSLSANEFVKYKPGFALGILGKLFVPIGEYDEKKALNLGSNRWGTQLGVPMAYTIGSSLVDPTLWRFELLPSISIYADNDDPYNAENCEKDPLYNVEGHITRNINQIIWLSFDGIYTYGGETTTDGVNDDNTQRSISLGGTVNVMFSKNISMKLSYGEVVDHNDSGADGWMTRAIFNYTF